MNYYRYKGLILTLDMVPIATGFNRIVHGGRGDYVEFDEDQMIKKNLFIPQDQEYRITDELVYYVEYRTLDGTKVYFQKKLVDYADYKIGKYYISPRELANFDKIKI